MNPSDVLEQESLTTCSDKAHIVKGTMKQFWQPLMLREISQEIVIKAVRWSEHIQETDESLSDCTYLIFELLSSVSVHLDTKSDMRTH